MLLSFKAMGLGGHVLYKHRWEAIRGLETPFPKVLIFPSYSPHELCVNGAAGKAEFLHTPRRPQVAVGAA